MMLILIRFQLATCKNVVGIDGESNERTRKHEAERKGQGHWWIKYSIMYRFIISSKVQNRLFDRFVLYFNVDFSWLHSYEIEYVYLLLEN